MSQFPRTGFGRRLASWVYDALACIAIIMVSEVLFLTLLQIPLALDLLVKPEEMDVSQFIADTPWLSLFHQFYLVACGVFFFAYFWGKGGQTIGMRAWRLKVQNLDGSPINKKQAVIRAVTAFLGLGNLVVLLDFKNKRALQDYIAGTEMVTLSKEENKSVYSKLD